MSANLQILLGMSKEVTMRPVVDCKQLAYPSLAACVVCLRVRWPVLDPSLSGSLLSSLLGQMPVQLQPKLNVAAPGGNKSDLGQSLHPHLHPVLTLCMATGCVRKL